MSPTIPAWNDGAGRVIAVERRQERERIAADVEALGCLGTDGTCFATDEEMLHRDDRCPIAIAAMIRAGGKKP